MMPFLAVVAILLGFMLSVRQYHKWKGTTFESPEDEILISDHVGKTIDLSELSKKIQDLLYLQEFHFIKHETAQSTEFEEVIIAEHQPWTMTHLVKITISEKHGGFTVHGNFSKLDSALNESFTMSGSKTEQKSLKAKKRSWMAFQR